MCYGFASHLVEERVQTAEWWPKELRKHVLEPGLIPEREELLLTDRT